MLRGHWFCAPKFRRVFFLLQDPALKVMSCVYFLCEQIIFPLLPSVLSATCPADQEVSNLPIVAMVS